MAPIRVKLSMNLFPKLKISIRGPFKDTRSSSEYCIRTLSEALLWDQDGSMAWAPECKLWSVVLRPVNRTESIATDSVTSFLERHWKVKLSSLATFTISKSQKPSSKLYPQYNKHCNRISYVHVSDLADAYRRAVDAPVTVIEGQVFNIVGFSHPTNEEVRAQFLYKYNYHWTLLICIVRFFWLQQRWRVSRANQSLSNRVMTGKITLIVTRYVRRWKQCVCCAGLRVTSELWKTSKFCCRRTKQAMASLCKALTSRCIENKVAEFEMSVLLVTPDTFLDRDLEYCSCCSLLCRTRQY